MVNFESLKSLWENKTVSFNDFDNLIKALDEKYVVECKQPYSFEAHGLQADGSSRWDCINKKAITKDKNKHVSLNEYFTFYTKES